MECNGNYGGNVADMDTQTVSESLFIERGSSFDVISFLSTHIHSLLRKSNEDIVVDLNILEGKVVMICCFSLPTDLAVAQAVLLASSELHALGAFELVIVVNVGDNVAAFNHFVSRFPSICLFVPYLDCVGVCESLNFIRGAKPTGLLVNRNHKIVWHKPLEFLLEYGVDAFPFTPERFAVITEHDETLKSEKCLYYFLSCTPLPFPTLDTVLYKNPGGGIEKEDLFKLKSKCVGLYLCQTGNLIPTLDKIQKKCCDYGLEFEIILVYMAFNDFGDPQLFQNRINSMLQNRKISWWVLPYVNWVSRRLLRLCHKDADDRLIILDPKSETVEFHGETIIRHFGVSAYPFSMELVCNRELKRHRNRHRAVTLESLLVYRSRDYVSLLDRPGFTYRVPVAALQGKTVLLYLHYSRDHSAKTFDKLVSYCQTKVDDPNFEVVFLALDKTSFDNFGSSCGMPWLVCPFDREHVAHVTTALFGSSGKYSTFVAFGKYGQICSIRAQQLVCSSCPDFPFAGNKLLRVNPPVPVDMYLRARTNFKALRPLLGREYFFPDIPHVGAMKPPETHDNADEDKRNHYSVFKIDYHAAVDEIAEYPSDTQEKIPIIDTENFDVVPFLLANNVDHLVRNDNLYGRVEVESLRDKEWVMICCFFCPLFYKSFDAYFCRAVSHVCSDLYEKYGDSFEMVLVLKMYKDFEEDMLAFNHLCSGFHPSCLVVPYWKSRSRDSICCSLGFSINTKGLFVHATERKVIWQKNLSCFGRNGIDTFPFTEEDFQKLRLEERTISWKDQSLQDLLGCSTTTIIAKNPCIDYCKTTIEQLGEKIVGVYLCYDGTSIPGLHELYECCKANNFEFEIVVVYFPVVASINPELSGEMINRALEKRKISWWVLPFKSWVSLRLHRLMGFSMDEKLIIVGKGKGVVDPDGSYFIRQFESLRKGTSSSRRGVPLDGSDQKQMIVSEFKSKYVAAM